MAEYKNKREEYLKNAVNVPLMEEDRKAVDVAAQKLGLTNAAFFRMLAKQYISNKKV